MTHLEVTSFDERQHLSSLVDPRIWVGHFHVVDLIITDNGLGEATCGGIDFKSNTKYRLSDTGRSSLSSAPRPAATKHSVIQSIFHDRNSVLFNDFTNQSVDHTTRKRRKKVSEEVSNDILKTPISSKSHGRSVSKPFFEFFIGVSESIVELMKAMNDHGHRCKGNLHFRRSQVITRRLALSVRCQCSLGKLCPVLPFGDFKWQSTPDISITPTKSVPVPDVLYALGVCMTPNTMAHADQLFSAMLLTPPSRNLLKEIIRTVIDPYLVSEKQRIVEAACREIRDSGLSPILCMDVGHSSARNSQAATLAAASGNVLLFTMTDTKTNAWLKETALVERALDYAIIHEKLDVCMVEIDDNAKNASIISSYTRVNGPEPCRTEAVKAGIDVFHAAKAMGKHIIKITAENVLTMEKFFKPLCQNGCLASEVVGRVNDLMVAKSNLFFNDMTAIFSDYGAKEWKAASESPSTMREFAVTNHLYDITENSSYWEPVVAAWNLIFAGKGTVTSIAKVKISISMSCKTLRLIALSVQTATGNTFVVSDKHNEKVELFLYMRKCLPEVCYRGNNISNDLAIITKEIGCIIKELPANETISHIDPDEDVLSHIFGPGINNRTVKDVRKLNTKKKTAHAKYLAMKTDTPAPDKVVSKMRQFCVINIWRINDLWEDVHQAMGIAQRAFIARLGEFKRTLKNLFSVVNDQFGGWSLKFKMYFLINGLLNFVSHFSNQHDNCARYFWWTQCCDVRENYKPTQEYCTLLVSGRGTACRDLIPPFFKLFVTSFVLSKYAETQFWKCLCFSKTTICESYFHWKSIMIPKWQNIPAQEYERKERAAFITFVRRQKGKIFLCKKLVTNKYANTLTIASAQKNSRYESHILDALRDICSSSRAVLAAVEHFTNKCNSRQDRRRGLLHTVTAQYEEDETAKNLNLGPVTLELRTVGSDGGPALQSFKELSFSARPVPPFPFQIGSLLDECQRYRLEKVWASSRALKRNRNENDLDNIDPDSILSLCALCGFAVDSEKIICSSCQLSVHPDCLENYNSEWESNDMGDSFCKECSGNIRLATTG